MYPILKSTLLKYFSKALTCPSVSLLCDYTFDTIKLASLNSHDLEMFHIRTVLSKQNFKSFRVKPLIFHMGIQGMRQGGDASLRVEHNKNLKYT